LKTLWTKYSAVVLICALLTHATAQADIKKETVVYARKNIYRGQAVEADDVAETLVDKNSIPSGAIRVREHAIGGPSLGVYCGQILVRKPIPRGENKGALAAGGYQPAIEIDRAMSPVHANTGVIDFTGAWIIPPKYCEIHYTPTSKYFWCTNLNHNLPKPERDLLQSRLGHYVVSDIWQALDYNGKPLNVQLPLCIEGIEWPIPGREGPAGAMKELLVFRARSGIGVCDDRGDIIINPYFSSIDKLTNGNFLCQKLVPQAKRAVGKKVPWWHGLFDETWEIRSAKGELLTKLPNSVWDARDGAENFVLCKLPSKWGVLTQSGKTIVPPRYISLNPFSEGLAAVTTDTNKVGYINSLGKVVIPFKYSQMSDFKNGLAFTTLELKPAKRLKNGELQFPETRRGAIDCSGKVIMPFEYDYLRWLPNSTILAVKANTSRVLDRQFKPLFEINRDISIWSWSEDRYLAYVYPGHANERKRKMQFLDRDGHCIGPKCEEIFKFHNGFAVVALDQKHYGVIDKQGQWIVPPKYAKLDLCGDNRIIAELDTESSSASVQLKP
jgi:hypothetical protein